MNSKTDNTLEEDSLLKDAYYTRYGSVPEIGQVFDLDSASGKESWKFRSTVGSNSTLLLCFSSLGAVYGDISTSPLYIFNSFLDSEVCEEDMFGAMSAVFYLFTAIIIVKLLLIGVYLRPFTAEGSQVAIYSRLAPIRRSLFIKLLCFAGCALVISDGLLTPNVSILNAVSGINMAVPSFNHTVPACLVVIVVTFLISYLGYQKFSWVFAPVILIWLISIAGIGIINILSYPKIILALNPIHGYNFLLSHGVSCMSSTILAITGTDVLYMDLSYVRQFPVQLCLICFVYPCLLLNYFGQSAYLINNSSSVTINVFYDSIPASTLSYWTMFFLATFSTIVSLQSSITGISVIVKQLSELRLFPKMKVYRTQKSIYIPSLNLLLMTGLICTIILFKDPKKMSTAYGLGISIDFFIASVFIILALIILYDSKVGAFALSVFIPIELFIIYTNMAKFKDGGWFTFFTSVVFFTYLLVYNQYK